MKLKFRAAPSIKDHKSTQQVMYELTIALLAVLVFSIVYYSIEYGTEYVANILLLLVVGLVTSFVLEFIYARTRSIPLRNQFFKSFPWVTPLILVLIMPVNTPAYAMFVVTAIGVFFGKLAFGGLGHNVFNPAGLGRAIFAVAMSGRVVEDLVTSVTPISYLHSYGWLLTDGSSEIFYDQFGGINNLLTGWHPGSLGETSFLLILALGIVLIIRDVIDWRVPVFYIASVFLTAWAVGLAGGVGIWYPISHVITGGVMFAAVFMLTDPVTNPTHPYGRALFAVGAGIITVLLRVKANMPGGVVFAILFMNMLTPAITRVLEGNQIKTLKNGRITMAVLVVLSLGIGWFAGSTMEAQEIPTSPISEISVTEENGIVTYELSSPGFYKATPNEFTVSIDTSTHTITSVVNTVFNDTKGYGDNATTDENLAKYEGLVVTDLTETGVDLVSGATFTSQSIEDAVMYAVEQYNEGGE